MDASIANVTLTGFSDMFQSRQHTEPKLAGENHDDFDIRTWMHKMHVDTIGKAKTVVIPQMALHQSIIAGAQYSKRQIPGQGKATWTAKFASGLIFYGNLPLNIDPETIGCIAISANADGVRGSGKRVTRRFPRILQGWVTNFNVMIVDPIITKDVFTEMVDLAGMFIGIGQNRPGNKGGGFGGRYKIDAIKWTDNRKIAA